MSRFAGVFTPIVTPFAGDEVDQPGLRANVARWVDTPLDGLVVLGSNGEAVQLDDDEADRVVATVREGVPRERALIVGAGRESTRATIAAIRRAAAMGADAVLVRTPSFFKAQMTTDAFVRHYTVVADASPVPVLLYNVTAYTGVNLLPDAVEQLAGHPNIVGLKESGSDLAQLAEYIERTPDDFTVMTGSASTYCPALETGAKGAILAVAALIPELCVEIWRLVRARRFDEAEALQRRLAPLARSVGADHGVPGLKAALHLLGYAAGPPRPPLLEAPPAVIDILRAQLEAIGAVPATSR